MPYAIKWRERNAPLGAKGFLFLTPTGGGSYLRAHAKKFIDQVAAQRALELVASKNSSLELTIINLEGDKS